MKRLKTFGLVVVMAFTVMLIGASAAMAESTALCEVDTSPCPNGKLVSHVHGVSIGR